MQPRDLADRDLWRIAGGRAEGGRARPAVLVVGFAPAAAERLGISLQGRAEVLTADDAERGHHLLESRPVDVLCLGERLGGRRARRFLDRERERDPASDRRDVVLAAGADLDLFQNLVDEDRLFYLSSRRPAVRDVEPILESALVARGRFESLSSAASPEDDSKPEPLAERAVLELVRRVSSEPRIEVVATEVAAEAARLIEAEEAACLVFDRENDTLWRAGSGGAGAAAAEGERAANTEVESAVAGLVGFVARTGQGVCLERAGADPRYDASADNPTGSPEDRILIVPSVAEGEVLALIVARREAARTPFGRAEHRDLERLADCLRPTFSQLALVADLSAAVEAPEASVYRREAVAHRRRSGSEPGRPLEISPAWSRWVFHLLLGLAVFALGFSWFGSIHEFASGPAVVVLGERIDVISRVTGTVTALEVAPGARVARGDLLARLYSAQEAAELDRIRHELELALVQRLRDPGDSAVGSALSSLRAQRDLAEARLEARSLRAPAPGFVSGLRAQPGQLVSPGQTVLTLGGEKRDPGIVALLPGRFRPLLTVGMELRFELDGYHHVPHTLRIEELGDEVLAPPEARRFLGSDLAEAVPVTGPVIWVKASLPADSFTSDDREIRFHEGVQGRVEVKVRSESILSALLPGIRGAFGGVS